MNNNKTVLVMTFSLIAVMLLAGCRAQPAQEPAATEAPPTQPQPAPTQTSAPTPTDEPTEAPTDEPTEAPTDVPTEPPTEAPAEAPVANVSVSFVNDVMPIIESRCVNCHGGQRTEEGLVMRSYEDIMAGSDNGPVIVQGDVANSLLVELIAAQKMPKKGPKLTPPQVQIITDWVAAGAPNN